MLQTDIRHDVVRSFYQPLTELEAAALEAVFLELRAEGSELLVAQGIAPDDHYFARSADMRYVGQEYTVNVPIDENVDLAAIDKSFHEAHRVRYGHSTPGAPVEFVNLRLAVFGRIAGDTAPFSTPLEDVDPLLGKRQVVFDGVPHESSVLLRERVRPGAHREGPLVIEEESSTTVVPPGYVVDVDEHGNLLIRRDR
jgi:N-methylhydantoinase A